jgi:hypothetical protein
LLTVSNNNYGANAYQEKKASSPYQRWHLNPAGESSCNSADVPPASVADVCLGRNSLRAGESYRMLNVGGKMHGYFPHLPKNFSGQSNVLSVTVDMSHGRKMCGPDKKKGV